MKRIEFHKWLPDLAPRTDKLVRVINTYLDKGRYKTLWGVHELTSELDGTPLIMPYTYQPGEDVYTFVGTTTKIYRFNPTTNTVTDISNTGGYSINKSDATWNYTIYGNSLIFVSLDEACQIINPYSTGNASDLSADAPKAHACSMFKDHLFLGNVIEGTDTYPRRLWRSGKGDPTDWTQSNSTGCGYYDIPEWGDAITAIRTLGDSLIVYLENAIYVINELGPPLWFSHICLAKGVGAIGPNAVAQIDRDTHIFLGRNSIYMLRGGEVRDIGIGISRYYTNLIHLYYRHLTTSFYDPETKNVYFIFYTTETESLPSRILAYNIESDSFTLMNADFVLLSWLLEPAATIDSLTKLVLDGHLYYTIDSAYYNDIYVKIGGVSANKRISDRSEPTKTMTLTTGEIDFQRIVTITKVIPLIDNYENNVTIRLYSKINSSDEYKIKEKTINSRDKACLFSTGRYIKFEIEVEGNHDGIYGLDYYVVPRGEI